MGAPASPPMNVGSSSSREFARRRVVRFQIARKSSASAFDSAAAGSSKTPWRPAVILALTTADVCGKPSPATERRGQERGQRLDADEE